MAAVFPPLLSDQPPDLAARAEFGGRFHYWRGTSGRRYLFSVVPPESLADFRSAVMIRAEPAADGRLAALSITPIDASGRLCGGELAGPNRSAIGGGLVLVHFLAASHGDRLRIVDDIAGTSAVSLAA